MAIFFKTQKDIEGLRVANKIVAQTLDYVGDFLSNGMSLLEVDKKIDDFIRQHGAEPAFKGLYGFPNASCLSLNEVVIHGIPDERILKEGDILGVDIGTKIGGYFGDSARTFPIGKISKQDEDLIACSKDALYFAIKKHKSRNVF